jgi:hypothetical protein
MTQSLSNGMNSPLALAAMVLWLLLAFLAVRACQKWAKERKIEKIIYKNHPAIPIKKYKLSDFTGSEEAVRKPTVVASSVKLSIEQQAQRRALLRNAWDT